MSQSDEGSVTKSKDEDEAHVIENMKHCATNLTIEDINLLMRYCTKTNDVILKFRLKSTECYGNYSARC
jgi:hypothetical protein